MLDDEMKWKTLPPMPKPDSHIEFAWAIVNNSLVIAGGTTEKHPITKKMILVGEVFQFNLDTLVSSSSYLLYGFIIENFRIFACTYILTSFTYFASCFLVHAR